MKFYQNVILKNGQTCLLRNARSSDAEALFAHFILTHEQTDNMITYSDEKDFDLEKEEQSLQKLENSVDEIMLCAILDERIVGTANLFRLSQKDKLKHRAIFAIALDRKVWGKGLGRALTEVCINCAKKANYRQIELEMVASNQAALTLYKSVGFVEYGRNPKAFLTRGGNYQELLLMRLELDEPAAK